VIYFLTFYTEGENIDGCSDLTNSVRSIYDNLSVHFDDMFFFNKRKLKLLPNSEDFCNEHTEVSEHFPNAHKLGYYDFKPFIINHVLNQIPENSILLYQDSNFEKYPSYWHTDWPNIQNICEKLLTDNYSDYWLKFELHNCYVKNFVKTWTVDYFFSDSTQNEIIKNSYLLNAGQIIIRNTQNSKELISEWLEYCKNKDLLKPTPNPNIHPETRIPGCVDQDIINCLIYKRILQGKLNPYFPQWGFNWRSIRLDNYFTLRNEQLISYLGE